MHKIWIESVIYQYPKPKGHYQQTTKSPSLKIQSKTLKWWVSGAVVGLLGPLIFPLVARSPAGGLFSGVTQALKEGTLTAEYRLTDGFLLRGEYRRDWSNQPFFLTEQPGVLKNEQNTATLGLVWWLGRKQGTW